MPSTGILCPSLPYRIIWKVGWRAVWETWWSSAARSAYLDGRGEGALHVEAVAPHAPSRGGKHRHCHPPCMLCADNHEWSAQGRLKLALESNLESGIWNQNSGNWGSWRIVQDGVICHMADPA